ncbi:hypothetical protein L7F22_020198 [Adiantum nelumboides]|nr:hypothetical protein [Adiantum nelumboides]
MVMHSQVVLDEDAFRTDVADNDRLAHIVNVSSAFGSLMFDLLVSRPDLAYGVGAFAVGVVSRAMTDTGIVHSGAFAVEVVSRPMTDTGIVHKGALQRCGPFFLLACIFLSTRSFLIAAPPTRLLVDSDVDSDDVFAILYLLKQDPSLFSLQGITISANAWADAGHAVNLIYDLLYMMGRDDVLVGVGGEGGISYEGNFSEDVGGYLPLIEQGSSTWGGCRYRQAIPPGPGGLLDIDTMLGVRKQFLPRVSSLS